MKESGEDRLRALVVDDEWPARSFLVELLQATSRVDVVAAVGTVAEAQQVLASDSPVTVDVGFVDVRLGGPRTGDSGLEWLRSVSRQPTRARFVLATAFPQHALEAFQLGVVDYLLKPFTDERVAECVRRLDAGGPRISTEPQPTRIVARRERALVFLDLPEVWACEASERVTYVHSARGRFDLDLTLSSIAASFGRSLVRVHRNWLVNASRVLEFRRGEDGNTLVVGSAFTREHAGVIVPVARDRVQSVRQLLLANATGIRD